MGMNTHRDGHDHAHGDGHRHGARGMSKNNFDSNNKTSYDMVHWMGISPQNLAHRS